MTDVAGATSASQRAKRRVPFFDTFAVRSVVWLLLALVLIAPIAITRLLTPAAAPHPSPSAPSTGSATLPSPAPPSTLSPPVAASAAPSEAIARTPPASVRDRLAVILRAYQTREDFGTPESAAQAASALQWCARQLADHEQTSVSDASTALSAALTDPRSAQGRRVVSAIEASAQGEDDTLRMQCALLLYAQLNVE